MGEIAIQVEGLSKRYKLGSRQPYKALRDTLSDWLYAPARAARAVIGGRQQQAAPAAPGSFWALKDVSFEVQRGEAVGIIGRNGAGKSTLLKLLSRVTRPTAGHARIYGRVGSLLEVGTGFHPELSGRENIFLNGTILGMKRREIARKFDEIVAFAEVEKFIDTPVKHYSSGMYTRLAFAVAAHLEPEILVVDEVLAVGDAAFQKKCLGKMGEVAKEGRTVLFVSHNMGAIQNLCGRTMMLDQGHTVIDGSTEAAISQYLRASQSARVQHLTERRDRQGSGKLRFIHIAMAGADRQNAPACGSPTMLELRYQGEPPLRNVHISIGFYTLLGDGCLYLSNDLTGNELSDLPASGSLRCSFERLPLLPGSYTINIYCMVNGHLADWIVNAAQIDVEDGDYFGTGKLPPKGYGTVLADHRWTAELAHGPN